MTLLNKLLSLFKKKPVQQRWPTYVDAQGQAPQGPKGGSGGKPTPPKVR